MIFNPKSNDKVIMLIKSTFDFLKSIMLIGLKLKEKEFFEIWRRGITPQIIESLDRMLLHM